MFKADLELVTALKENNEGNWNKRELSAALFAFCMTRGVQTNEAFYVLACMSGRHPDIIRDLTDLIRRLEEDSN